MNGSDSAPALMSIPEVARYLNMSERTIYDWAQSGKIPVFKLGSTWRFRRSEIDAWLERQHHGPDVSRGREPLVPPAEPQDTEYQRRQKLLDACRREIETALLDDSRKVFVIDQFVGQFPENVVDEVVEQLRQEKKISVSNVKDHDGESVKVIRRRRR